MGETDTMQLVYLCVLGAVLAGWFARVGGELVRVGVARARPVGSFTGWQPAMPVTIFSVVR